jgi:hypothetical protein
VSSELLEVEEAGGSTGRTADGFNRSIMEQLEHVEYRRVSLAEDLESVYRLRYDSFLRAGMVKEDASHMLSDRWDDLPNSYRFAVYYDGNLLSTVRIHYIEKAFPYSPAYDTFPEALAERVANGETFIDVSRFAAFGNSGPSTLAIPFLSMRLVTLAGLFFSEADVLYAIKPEHSAFYRRSFSARCIAGPKMFPGLVVPRFLYETPSGDNRTRVLERFPFMRGTKSEQRMLFGHPAEDAPLTVLPTAKFMHEPA